MTNRKEVRHPRKKVVEAIADGFREIEAHFELEGFPISRDETAENSERGGDQSEVQEEAEDEYGEEDFTGSGVFQREDIEVAIDVFVSRLVKDKVIRNIDRDDQPTLSEIFERFFGQDHEITEAAKAFEVYIKGYFGAIRYDEMNKALSQVASIRDNIKSELNRHAQR